MRIHYAIDDSLTLAVAAGADADRDNGDGGLLNHLTSHKVTSDLFGSSTEKESVPENAPCLCFGAYLFLLLLSFFHYNLVSACRFYAV